MIGLVEVGVIIDYGLFWWLVVRGVAPASVVFFTFWLLGERGAELREFGIRTYIGKRYR